MPPNSRRYNMDVKLASAVMQGVKYLAGGLGDLLLPAVCAGCGGRPSEHEGLCEQCNLGLLAAVAQGYCPRCGTTLGPNVPPAADGCWACPEPLPRWDCLVRLGPYAEPLRSIVQELKYRKQETMLVRLGVLLAEGVQARAPQAKLDLVVPVPMHWRRRLSRGYDHAKALAAAIARPLGIPLAGALARIRHTPPQAQLPRTARLTNIRGAFSVPDPAVVAGTTIILVDDVTTTGATTNEATRTLLAAGASHVILAVLAKADPPRAYANQAT